MAKATILMVARNRSGQFETAMNTIRDRRYQDVDVVVVDDGSVDDTPRIAKNYADCITRYHRIERKGIYRRNPSAVLNEGHRLCETDIVIEQGAEVCHMNDCVTPLVALCQPGTVVLARVYNGNPSDLSKVQFAMSCGKAPVIADYTPDNVRTDGDLFAVPAVDGRYFGGRGIDLYCGKERDVPFLFCGAIYREDFESAGGYDETLSGRNDEDLANRLKARGTKFVFSGSAIAFHQLHGKT